jgi:transposase
MRYYIGVDWADAADAVWVEDEPATKILARSVPHTVEGFTEWGRWLDEQRALGVELWAAIEKPDGRVVDFLLDHGVVVFAINPKAVDRARDRFRASASKSDLFDARVLATFLRTDHHHLSPLRPSSEPAQELKGLTRDYARQVRQQTRLLNQLTATLKAYYPRALELSEDLTHEWVRAFLHDYPTPAALAALTERQWQRWARGRRLSAERIAALWDVLRAPQLPVPPHVVRVSARLVGAVLEQLDVTVRTVQAYREAITDFFARMPAATWATSLPGGAAGRPCRPCTLNSATPQGAGTASGSSRRTPEASRSPTAAARMLPSSSASPVTSICGKPATSLPPTRSRTVSGPRRTTTAVASGGTGIIMPFAPSRRSGSKSCSCCGPGKSRTTRRITWRPWPDSTFAGLPDRKCLTGP